MFGDLNSHTADVDDFIDIDTSIMDSLNIDDEYLTEYFNKADRIEQFGLHKSRVSQDTKLNNSGHRLLELCRSNNLFILNGRCGLDKDVGACTYRQISLIDYAIASYAGIPYIHNFSIEDTDCLLSDGHCLLNASLSIHNMYTSAKIE